MASAHSELLGLSNNVNNERRYNADLYVFVSCLVVGFFGFTMQRYRVLALETTTKISEIARLSVRKVAEQNREWQCSVTSRKWTLVVILTSIHSMLIVGPILRAFRAIRNNGTNASATMIEFLLGLWLFDLDKHFFTVVKIYWPSHVPKAELIPRESSLPAVLKQRALF